RISLVGWGFGGLVALTAGAVGENVTGVATLAGTGNALDLVSELAPRRLLLIHGASDQMIAASASRALYATAAQPKELVIYPEADHDFANQRAELLDKLTMWNRRLLLTPYTSRAAAHAAS
ncbi:MAG: dienelactone hydrolase family protein, partial [Ktedonobacterales bacterium]